MTWILLGLALWLLQDLCHDFWEGPEQFCTAIPLEKMWWCLPFQLWKISQGNLQETINKTKSTESGWDRVRFLVAACTVLCSRFVTNTIMVTHLPFWSVFPTSRASLFLPLPLQWGGWRWAGCWEGTQQGRCAELPRRYPTSYHAAAAMKQRGGGLEMLAMFCFRTGWATVCLWEVVTGLHHLLCCNVFLFLSTPSSLIEQFLAGSKRFFVNTLPLLLPYSTGGEGKVRKQLCDT